MKIRKSTEQDFSRIMDIYFSIKRGFTNHTASCVDFFHQIKYDEL